MCLAHVSNILSQRAGKPNGREAIRDAARYFVDAKMQMTTNEEKLVTREQCIEALFAEGARPCARAWETLKKQRVIPFVRLGKKLHRYSVPAVREALKAYTVNAGRLAPRSA